MTVRALPILLLVSALAWAGPAAGVELRATAGAATMFDSNVNRVDSDGGGKAGSIGGRGYVQLDLASDDGAKLGWGLRYRASYRLFAQETASNGLTHDVSGRFNYPLGPSTLLTGSDTLRISRVYDFTREDPVEGDTGEVIDETTPIDRGRALALRNRTHLNLRHRFSSRLTGNLSGGLAIFDSEASNRVNSQSFTGSANLNYRVDGAHTVGLGGGVTVQLFGDADTGSVAQSRSQTTIFRLFGSLTRRLGETTTLTVQVGPAFILTDQEPLDRREKDVTQVPFREIGAEETLDTDGNPDTDDDKVVGERVAVFGRSYTGPGVDEPVALLFENPDGPILGSLGLEPVTQPNGLAALGSRQLFLPAGSLLVSERRECSLLGESFVVVNGRCGAGLFLTSDPDQTFARDTGPIPTPVFGDSPDFLDNAPEIGAAHPDAIQEVLSRQAGGANSVDITRFATGEDDEGVSDSRFTIFASVSLTKRWSPEFVTTLSYRRSESQASGLSASNLQDSVTLSGNWRPGDRWSFRGSVFWVQRESFSEIRRTFQQAGVIDLENDPGDFGSLSSADLFPLGTDLGGRTGFLISHTIDNPVDTTRWGMRLRAERRITRNLIGTLKLFYNQQDSRGISGISQSFDDFTAILGVKYTFDPLHL